MTSWWFLDRVPFWRKTGISGGTKDCNYQNSDILPETQTVLLLYNLGQPYQLISNYAVPQLGATEVLVRTRAIGLNHIDWKAPDFNFAIPKLPYISGRELSGQVTRIMDSTSRLKVGDRVIIISTDYRDIRKAAFQEYVAGFEFNTARIPADLSFEQAATLGVSFVAAALALGICMGVDFSNVLRGPDLWSIVRGVKLDSLSPDAIGECLNGIDEPSRARPGEWMAIWGGSATSANLTFQLARLAGLKVALVVDSAKHGLRLSNQDTICPDLVVDSHDPQRAVDIIKANCSGRLRFGMDTRGSDSATSLLQALTPINTEENTDGACKARPLSQEITAEPLLLSAHLVGLTGLPKQCPPEGTLFHQVPIKLFHEAPPVGAALVTWLERLLQNGLLHMPKIIYIEDGLENVNRGLNKMRNREISGGKLIVRLP